MFAIRAIANVRDHSTRHDLLPIKTTITTHGLTEARKVTQRRVDPAAARLRAHAVHLIQRVVFAA